MKMVIVNITPREAKELKEDGWMNYKGVIVYDPVTALDHSQALTRIRKRAKKRYRETGA